MLQKLNERIQGFVAWIIIVLVAITFTLFGIDYYMQSHQESNAQVEVNGQVISKQVYESKYRRARQSQDQAQMTALSDNQLKQQILNELIVNDVSTQSAKALGFEVSAAQADAAILNIPQFQVEGHFSSDRYLQTLNNAFFTPESFQNEVRQGMLLNQQRFALIGTSFALPEDVNKFVQLYMQTRDYNYLQIPASLFIDKISVSEKEIKTYYEAHKQLFLAPEKVSIDYILLSMQDIKKTIQLSDEEIKRYYDENSAAMTQSFSEMQAGIKEQLVAELAQTKYADKLEQLSDLSYQTPDSLAPVADALNIKIKESNLFSQQGNDADSLLANKKVIDAAFAHDVLELGNNSEPIQIDNDSVIVLRVNKHELPKERTLNQVRPLILKKLMHELAEKQTQQLGKKLLEAKNNPVEQNQLISKNNLKWINVNRSSRDNESLPATINELAFSLPQAPDMMGTNLPNGDYVIVSLKTIEPGKLDSVDNERLASLKQQIETNYGVMDYELYVNGLMNNARIVKY